MTAVDSPGRTMLVAVLVSLVCSVVVATAAVTLRPIQNANRQQNRQKVILEVAGLSESPLSVSERFAGIETKIVDLESGNYVETEAPQEFDPLRAASNTATSTRIPEDLDHAGLKRRSRQMPVYLVRENDRLTRVVLPVYGAGLWSTLYGYIALEADARTVSALRFYEHAETPGLGDQIDSADWLASWQGKRLYDKDGALLLRVVKGAAATSGDAVDYEIDGLSGATLTGNGVSNIVHYWFGEHGYAPYLAGLESRGETRGN